MKKLWKVGFALFLGLLFSLNSPLNAADANTSEATAPNEPPASSSVGLDLEYTPILYPKYQWLQGVTNNRNGNGLHMGIEWIPLPNQYGKLGIGLGSGAYWISNFSLNRSYQASLTAIPIETFIDYRLDYFENQILVPFAKVGVDKTFVIQSTQAPDGLRSGNRIYSGFDWWIGGEFNLSVLDREGATGLRDDIGIQGTYLIFEYGKSRPLQSAELVDLSHEEYLAGLRFEL